MNRYFDFPDERKVLVVGCKVGSKAAQASPDTIAKYFGMNGHVREVKKAEHEKLWKKYTEVGADE